jgi:hypothetical protein
MNPDGSDKKELKKLWEDTKMFIDINGNTSFMDICYKTKQAAIAFSAGHKDQTGIWLINLDGTGFKRIWKEQWKDDYKPFVNHPSWFPDGSHLVFEEGWGHTANIQYYIVKIDREGKEKVYLTSKENDGTTNRFPAVSPDGKQIAYTHIIWKKEKANFKENIESGLYVMNIDGINKKLLYEGYADYPEWSPDGKRIHVIRPLFTIIDAETGMMVKEDRKFSTGKVHWSREHGFIIDGRGSISIYKEEKVTDLALAKIIQTENKRDISKYEYKWGRK